MEKLIRGEFLFGIVGDHQQFKIQIIKYSIRKWKRDFCKQMQRPTQNTMKKAKKQIQIGGKEGER